ncbi:hypothetical protein YC2023_113414 [Brassica napus]|uniref:(rape) hypothetical protein n=1 Tax=Brassica napus TaxID=3708 RepID=A0A816IR23_BRANA|nr:unnamed protein product [Brassica napus]
MTKLTGVRTAEVKNPMGHCEQDPSSYQLLQFLRTLLRIPGPAFAPHISQYKLSTLLSSGGGNNPNDNMHGANCASCKFYIGDSSEQEMDASQLLRKQYHTLSRRIASFVVFCFLCF